MVEIELETLEPQGTLFEENSRKREREREREECSCCAARMDAMRCVCKLVSARRLNYVSKIRRRQKSKHELR